MMITVIPHLIAGTAHSTPVASLFVISNVFLTGLQWFWGYKIFFILLGSFFPKSKKAKTAATDVDNNNKTK